MCSREEVLALGPELFAFINQRELAVDHHFPFEYGPVLK